MSKCGRRRTPRIRDVRRRPRWIAIGKAIGRLRRSVSGGIGQIGVFLSPRLGGTANGIRTVRPGGLPLPNRSLFSPTPFVVSSPRRFAPICLSAAPCVKFFPPQVKDFPLFPEYWSEGRVRTRCPPASREKGFRHGLQLPIPLSPTGGTGALARPRARHLHGIRHQWTVRPHMDGRGVRPPSLGSRELTWPPRSIRPSPP